MENAKVVLFEDNKHVIDLIHLIFNQTSHEIVAEAATRKEALDVIEHIQAGDLHADVIVLDGALDSTNPGADAKFITTVVREWKLAAKVIGFSTYPMDELGVEVDLDVGKNPFLLARSINDL
jgi:CheY-like chemotaxis protein